MSKHALPETDGNKARVDKKSNEIKARQNGDSASLLKPEKAPQVVSKLTKPLLGKSSELSQRKDHTVSSPISTLHLVEKQPEPKGTANLLRQPVISLVKSPQRPATPELKRPKIDLCEPAG